MKRVVFPQPLLIAARGSDAVRYLNGQMTQDVRLVAPGERALPACVTDAKGRLQFRIWLFQWQEGEWLLSCDHEGAEGLMARLDRYLIADDAILEELRGWRREHVISEEKPLLPEGGHAVPCERVGLMGWDCWLPESSADQWIESIPVWDADEAESQRIRRGIPVWGRELEVNLLPPEAGLDRTDISYAKGCYIGQEVISRIRSAGKLNRRLYRLEIDEAVAIQEGEQLIDSESREAGVITSVAPVAEGGRRALMGYVKRVSDGLPLKVGVEAQIEVKSNGQV